MESLLDFTMLASTSLTCALLAALAVAAFYSPSSRAEKLYRWVDAHGQVHFTDQPGEHHAEPYDPHLPAPTQAPVKKFPPVKADQRARCKKLHTELDHYRQASTIVETDALGHRHVYTPNQRKELIARTQKTTARVCSGTVGGADEPAPAGAASARPADTYAR